MATTAQILSGYAQPARPVTPTPTSPDDIADALWGGGTAPAPLPPGLPQNVQDYIHQQPSYGEGDVQAPQQWARIGEADAQDAPGTPPLNPQPGDIQNLFRNRIIQNAPTSDERAIRDQQFRELMQTRGFAGFTGGTNI